jgi:hypothetical protein
MTLFNELLFGIQQGVQKSTDVTPSTLASSKKYIFLEVIEKIRSNRPIQTTIRLNRGNFISIPINLKKECYDQLIT